MSRQGILIIIIPNDLNIQQDPSDSTIKSDEVETKPEHTKDYPCPACGSSLASRFRFHITPKLNLVDAIWILSEDRQSYFITCFAELGPYSDMIIEELRLAEIGIRPGSKVFILPLSCAVGVDKLLSTASDLFKIEEMPGETDATTISNDESQPLVNNDQELNERLGKDKSDFKRSIRARLTVLQVVNAIRGQAVFSFDFLLLTILASIIALLGLLEDNSVILVASMLVSPLMGPILGIVFGLCIGESTLWRVGLKTEVVGLLVAILTGFVGGLCTTWSEVKWGSSNAFPTREMWIRGDIRRLWIGALVALPSGAGAALSVLGGNVGSLVGVAISASLLPPAVNAGLLSSYAFLSAAIPSLGKQSSVDIDYQNLHSLTTIVKNCTQFEGNDYVPIYACNMATEAGLLGICSFVLTMTNIICIIVVAMVILRIKEVVPIVRDDQIAEFWHHDVPIVRGQNQKILPTDINHLVNIWKTMANNSPSALPMGQTAPNIKSSDDKKQLNKSELILARKLRNLQEFAHAYNLNLSSDDDILVKTDQARENIQRMAHDLLKSREETDQMNFGSFVAQSYGRSLKQPHIRTFYDDLVDVMPMNWKEIFEQCQEQSK